MSALEQSYRFCTGVARAKAKNFYYSFLLLSRDQRESMCAIYAFMRASDDLSDEAEPATPEAMREWRQQLTEALGGRYPAHLCWPAFHDTVRRYSIPHRYFYDMVDGVSSDLEPRRIETFDELYRYCYQVASVVGLTIVHIFGFQSERALELAEKCGIAFQLTNILRDVKEDAERGRVYLPAEDLARFGVSIDDLRAESASPRFQEMMRFEAQRAHRYYTEAMPLISLVDSGSRASLRALIGVYRRLLERIEQANYEVLDRRIRLPGWEKIWILMRSVAA